MKLAFLACAGLSIAAQACEFECEPPVVACRSLELDVIFALDDSGSMGTTDWRDQIAFTKQLATGMDEKFGGTRMGLVQWGSSSPPLCPGSTTASPCSRVKLDYAPPPPAKRLDNFITKLEALTKTGGATPTEDAFDTCAQEFARTKRVGVQQICIVVTDGGATYPGAAASAALALKDGGNGPTILMVGVGSIDAGQINLWASDPKSLYAHTSPDFDKVISDTLPNIIASVCFAVDAFENGCVEEMKTVQVKGSGFIQTGTGPKCVFKQGSREKLVDATFTSITTATCQIPTIGDEKSSPPVIVADPDNPPPDYFPTGVYTFEVSRDYGEKQDGLGNPAYTTSRNANLLLLVRDCSAIPTVDPNGFNPFDTGGKSQAESEQDGNVDAASSDDAARRDTTENDEVSGAASQTPLLAVAFAAMVAFFF